MNGRVVAHDSPESAVMAEWAHHRAAQAFVVRVEYIDEHHATVITDTVPSHPMANDCFRKLDGWHFSGDSTA